MPPHAHSHGAPREKLPRNQQLVLKRLKTARAPQTAYDLLDALRHDGFRAPLTVYRALEALREKGLVHRIESMKAFVACSHEDHDERPAFAVCGQCGAVLEIDDPALATLIERLAARTGFAVARAMIELEGTCQRCAEGNA